MRRRRASCARAAWWLAVIAVASGHLACASASDVERRGRAVLDATEPEQHAFCPPEHLARARAEVAFARAAAERGEALAAATHLERAERHAAAVEAERATCGAGSLTVPVTPPPIPETPPPTAPPTPPPGELPTARDDADGDGFSDVLDKCPHEPEDEDGYDDLDGCPEPDAPAGPGD